MHKIVFGVSVQYSVSVRTVWMSKHGHHLVLIIEFFCRSLFLTHALGSSLTGYLLQYQVHDLTSTIQLPALNTSYTLESVPSGAAYNITISALSNVGPSRNNPSVQFGKFDMPYQGCRQGGLNLTLLEKNLEKQERKKQLLGYKHAALRHFQPTCMV